MLAIIIAEGYWCAINGVEPMRFFHYLGFTPGTSGTLVSWVAACVIAAAYVAQGTRLPSVKKHLFKPSALKLLALLMAIVAAVLEEAFSKKLLMDYLQQQGFGIVTQVMVSGAAFGLAHGVWGLLGRSLRAAIGATLYTFVMGTSLSIVYILAGRSLAPCIFAHFWITFLLEPGLLFAAIRGEMSRFRS
jgi:hypothetical protein